VTFRRFCCARQHWARAAVAAVVRPSALLPRTIAADHAPPDAGFESTVPRRRVFALQSVGVG